MKKRSEKLLCWVAIITAFHLLSAFDEVSVSNETSRHSIPQDANDSLKRAAFEVLDSKCNVCHRKQNPFKVFSIKNMEKRAPKIYTQVIVKRRMPKGTKIRLTNEEYVTLEKWFLTQNIN